MGYRWIHARLRWSQQQDHGNYSRVISDLDILSADLVDWDPWCMARVKEIADGGLLASSCSRDADLWLTTCFLLYMNCVEVYSPERVQRQFGYRQVVPVPAPRDAGRAHEWSSKGGGGTQDWASKNAEYIQRWTESAAVDVIITAGQYDEATYWDYLAWYRPRTRATLLSGPVQPDPRPFPEDRARLLHVVTEEAYEMHTQADQPFGEPSRSSSQRDRNPLREYMRTRGSRFLNAIRGLGGCAPQWRGYDQHAMDPSRASHSRQSSHSRRSSSAREEPVRSESRHTSSASARHVSCSGAEAEECTQPPVPEQVTLGSLAPLATMTPPAAASTHQEDVVDYT
ncbi:uncharacterized protein LOC133912928 [Phragmites australis]|uniref:uncharacterized protein LOC133912928 n=1 Tax=Phragmites australis TaxID=29695 RepID=UPI002D7A06E3|nr:uncharacterized protein LOC133912928 [Phragmites australis]